MKKKIMIATGLLGLVAPNLSNSESQAYNTPDILQKTVNINKLAKVKGVASNDVLNVRTLPNSTGTIVFTLKNATSINVIGQDSSTGWYKVSYNGKEGYASNRYIEIVSPNTKTYVVTGDINIRKDDSWSAEKMAVVKKGEILEVVSINGDWAEVYYEDNIRYAPSSYLKSTTNGNTQTPSTPPTQESPNTVKYKVTGDINIRNEKSWSGEKMGVVKKDSVLEVLEVESSWCKVVYGSGFGYAPTSYLEKVTIENTPSDTPNDTPNEDTSSKKGQVATVNTNDLNVRAGAGTSYSILAKVNRGDVVLVKEKNSNGWYKIELSSGIVGWCNGHYLENFREGSLDENINPPISVDKQELINKVVSIAKEQIGKPYKYGATGPNSFDCSGLTSYAFKNGAGITLPRSSKDQSTVGQFVSKSNLQPGDLIFFNTSGSGISHVGIYLGNDEMVHAPSSGKNIQIVKITTSYWENAYVTARRVIY